MCSINETWRVERSDFVAAAKARIAFRACLTDLSAAGSDLDAAEIIFGELMTNAIRYSGTDATALLRCHDVAFVLEVRDRGPGFDPGIVRDGKRLGDVDGGRGLLIARKLATDLHVAATDNGCLVAARLPASCQPAQVA